MEVVLAVMAAQQPQLVFSKELDRQLMVVVLRNLDRGKLRRIMDREAQRNHHDNRW